MRLFLSCNVPEEISRYVFGLAKELPEAKLSVPHNIDLTVKFLGNVQDDKVEEIKQKLGRLRFRAFKATLNSVGVFTEDFVRVVWVGLSPEEPFNNLHEQVDGLLKDFFPVEKRFKPHLTIARVKFVEDKKAFLEALKKIKVEPKTFTINKLILFQSRISPKGAVHKALMEINAE